MTADCSDYGTAAITVTPPPASDTTDFGDALKGIAGSVDSAS
ncbi:hypothetical protein [Streptomyces tateyamensis]|nr:hypothetical protein [Streptomyces tateyamensis]